jgi:hypothetical protein
MNRENKIYIDSLFQNTAQSALVFTVVVIIFVLFSLTKASQTSPYTNTKSCNRSAEDVAVQTLLFSSSPAGSPWPLQYTCLMGCDDGGNGGDGGGDGGDWARVREVKCVVKRRRRETVS